MSNMIFLIERTDNGTTWDTYDSFVCIAENEESAKMTHPNTYNPVFGEHSWVRSVNDVSAKFLGFTELPPQIVCASFNAG